MNGFKKCKNGHFFKEDLSHCPYCPGESVDASKNLANNDLNKTMVAGAVTSHGTDHASTEVFGTPSSSSNQTKVFGSGSAQLQKKDLSRTFIGGITDSDPQNTGDGTSLEPSIPRASRRIVGWILSYTLDPMGVDYRLYEGNNTIGREPSNSITISKDSTISGKHANILYKKGSFWIKDEMAANGTFINDEEIEIEKAYPLKDGDTIRMGSTTFRFKSSE